MTPRNYCSSLGLVLETKNASLGIDISYIYCQTTKIALWDLWISLHQLLTVPGVQGTRPGGDAVLHPDLGCQAPSSASSVTKNDFFVYGTSPREQLGV